MSDNIDQKKTDEVDLIQLFNYFGNLLAKFFSRVKGGGVFFFKNIIYFILFIKKHSFKMFLALIIGGCFGYYIQRGSPKLYKSEMIVRPNFESSRQLYTSIEYLNQLTLNQNFEVLGNELNVSVEEAESIKSLYCEPLLEENNKIKVYDEFISSLQDTASASKVNFKDFVKNLSDYDNKYHRVIVESSSRIIFKKLQKNIIELIGRNEYFKEKRKIQEQSLKKSEEIFNKQLDDIDSLRFVYNQVLLADTKSNENKRKSESAGGNTFNFAKDDKKTQELELLKESRVINEKLIDLNKEKLKLTSIVNVISDFNPIGKPVNSFFRNKIIIWALLFSGFVILVLLLLELNKFIGQYERVDQDEKKKDK